MQELEALNVLYKLQTIYLGEKVIPKFKQRKVKVYQKILQQFNVLMINNAHQTVSFWGNVLTIPKV